MERTMGIEEARGRLGKLADDVAGGGDAVILVKRGRAKAVLVDRGEYLRFKVAASEQARARLAELMETIRENAGRSGLEPGVVQEAIEAVRRLP